MTKPQATFVRATHADCDDIVALVESAYRGESSRAGWTTEADLISGQRTDALEVAEHLRDPAAHFLIARQNGALVASMLLRVEGSAAELGMFAVHPPLQGHGYGTSLLEEAERQARDAGAETARMKVIRQRPDVIRWYIARGYRLTDETAPFPYGEPRFGLPERDDLEFAVLQKRL